jgi:1,2-diacylglycerol 3-beta-glucosyltransferase
MWIVLLTLLLIIQLALAALVSYLLLLTLTAHRAPRHTAPAPNGPKHDFVILIPAHNEEGLLPSLLDSLNQMDYPASKFGIHVVADNCNDATVEVAQAHGATVHQRFNLEERGKGYALNWLFDRLKQLKETGDAYVILDADTIVSNNFLQVMDTLLQQGARVVQAYYSVREPQKSWSSSLRFAALAVIHYLRPQGRTVLGASAGLKGNGMVFLKEVIEKYPWSHAITEDIETHMALLLNGEQVIFAPDAIVWAEMPDQLANAETQHDRWERGRLEMARKYVPRLLRKAWQAVRQRNCRRAYMLLDAVLEHIIPPFSILVGLSALLFFTSTFTYFHFTPLPLGIFSSTAATLASLNLLTAIFIITGEAFYIFSGLSMVKAPKNIYMALVLAPVLILWKIGHYIKVLIQRDSQEWVRTSRNQAS